MECRNFPFPGIPPLACRLCMHLISFHGAPFSHPLSKTVDRGGRGCKTTAAITRKARIFLLSFCTQAVGKLVGRYNAQAQALKGPLLCGRITSTNLLPCNTTFAKTSGIDFQELMTQVPFLLVRSLQCSFLSSTRSRGGARSLIRRHRSARHIKRHPARTRRSVSLRGKSPSSRKACTGPFVCHDFSA
jgi:hypothetical protein